MITVPESPSEAYFEGRFLGAVSRLTHSTCPNCLAHTDMPECEFCGASLTERIRLWLMSPGGHIPSDYSAWLEHELEDRGVIEMNRGQKTYRVIGPTEAGTA